MLSNLVLDKLIAAEVSAFTAFSNAFVGPVVEMPSVVIVPVGAR